jgi:WS/DGAT/MGAT family acyltransferase
MREDAQPTSTPLGPEDLVMWSVDQPRQRTTMALLMLLDRRPDPERLRAAVERAIRAVPRMRERVVEAPFDLSLPRWESDPTFDLDYHLRRYAQAEPEPGEDELEALFRTVGPIYERPFDRTRPLWELIEIDRAEGRSAVFFRLHHAMADGVGGNAILAALTDADREGQPLPPSSRKTPGRWEEPPFAARLARAATRRVGEGLDRARLAAGAVATGVRHPGRALDVGRAVARTVWDGRAAGRSHQVEFGRSRHLSGFSLDFEPLRRARRVLDGRMIDLLLAGVAGAMEGWYRAHGDADVREALTAVPINLRPPEERGLAAQLGNRTTMVIIRLPLGLRDPRKRIAEIHRRMEEAKASPTTELTPQLARLLSGAPRWLFRAVSVPVSGNMDLIVTNVPGLPVERYLAGARITAGFPIAPTAPHTPVSIALYGYAGRLYVGLDADGTAMTDAGEFRAQLERSFAEIVHAAEEAAREAGAGMAAGEARPA